MKANRLLILSAVTMLVAGAAIYSVHMQTEHTAAMPEAQSLFPRLKSEINDIDEVSVQDHAGTFSVKRNADGSWVVPSKYDFPADFKMVKKVILDFADMKTVEAKTDDPKLFGELGLQDPTADGAKSSLVTLKSGDKTVASLLFGERKYTPGSADARIYVRKPEGGRAWRVDTAPDVQGDIKRWMSSESVALPRERVKEVEISGPDRATLTVYRDAKTDTNFQVRDMPKGAKLEYPSVANAIGGALSYVGFDDVKPVGDVDFSKADTVRYQTFDGLQVTASVAKIDGASWIKYEAEALPGASTPAAPVQATDDAAKDATTADKNKDAKDKTPDIPAEAKAINERVSRWAYKIPDYKAGDLTKQLSDLLAKDKKEPPKGGKASTSGT